ncbi:DUF6542 domain-containing protein [Corynebacterium meitnerae]|uniref:DUF6542 domain-containing protein n=1 Tax=Corynebacterium meitnerae TaxID=2913498 RepID=A0A9X3RKD9_9CORY|nr:DUF6542 domain-containing protein [Corynebacterium meitnerae]MCZ9294156.1 hypothetical protein [Corynebacterium meitnerae]
MSHASPRSAPAQDTTLSGFSLGSGLGILIAALVTGGLISLYTEFIGWPFLAIFALASVVVATFVNPRGLFITVVSIPVLFTFFLLFTGTLNAYFSLPEGQTSLGRTSVLVILYPLVQFFPVLAMVTLGALLIAFVRYQLLKRLNDDIRRHELRQRRRTNEANRRSVREASRSRQLPERTTTPTPRQRLAEKTPAPTTRRRARNRSRNNDNRVTVDELLARRERDASKSSSTSAANKVRRRLSDDLYGD